MDRSTIFKIVRDEVATICHIPPEQIEPSDELFDLGIDSVSIAELVERLSARFNSDLWVKDFFISPCVDGIVDLIDTKLAESHE